MMSGDSSERIGKRPARAADEEPEEPDPDAPAQGDRQPLAERSPDRTVLAEEHRGMAGRPNELVAPRSRRAKASTPIASRTTATIATGTSDAQSYWPASGR